MSSFPGDRPAFSIPCLIIALAFCVMSTGFAVILWINFSSNSGPIAQALTTPTSQTAPGTTSPSEPATATSTATAIPTARLSGPSATAQAARTAVATHLAWPVVLSDTFDNNDNRWRVSPSVSELGSAQWTITQSVFILDLEGKQGIFLGSHPAQLASVSDVSLSVDVRHVAGSDDAHYGVLLRSDGNNYYFVNINAAQEVAVSLLLEHKWTTLLRLKSSAIRPEAVNQFLVDAIGPQITVFINGSFAGAVSDSTLRSGTAGVGADIGADQTTRIQFDNFIVRIAPEVAAIAAQTATARAERGTATAQAVRATATAHAQWPIVISDTFTGNPNGWSIGKTADAYGVLNRQLGDGRFRWDAHADKDVYWEYWPSMGAYEDINYAVEVKWISGTNRARYGIIFRQLVSNEYLFEVSENQQFAFSVYSTGTWKTIIAWTASNAIHPGMVNRLAVDATGSHFQFLINGEYVAQADDSTLSRGRVGLALTLKADEDTSVNSEISSYMRTISQPQRHRRARQLPRRCLPPQRRKRPPPPPMQPWHLPLPLSKPRTQQLRLRHAALKPSIPNGRWSLRTRSALMGMTGRWTMRPPVLGACTRRSAKACIAGKPLLQRMPSGRKYRRCRRRLPILRYRSKCAC